MKPQLSGFNFWATNYSTTTHRGKWKTETNTKNFKVCTDPECKNETEHEYAFDGQVFYKKSAPTGSN